MNRKLFVKNLNSNITENDLLENFSYFGNVRFVNYIKSKGIAFVKMYNESDANTARLGLNGIELNGSHISVSEARY